MSRVQLALNVADLDEAVAFYTDLFGVGPAKVRPGYANFAVADPPLKLVLVEDRQRAPGSLDHLGVEVASSEEVAEAARRLAETGRPLTVRQATPCCFAVQDKVWVHGPAGHLWEVYTVLADSDEAVPASTAVPAPVPAPVPASAAVPAPAPASVPAGGPCC